MHVSLSVSVKSINTNLKTECTTFHSSHRRELNTLAATAKTLLLRALKLTLPGHARSSAQRNKDKPGASFEAGSPPVPISRIPCHCLSQHLSSGREQKRNACNSPVLRRLSERAAPGELGLGSGSPRGPGQLSDKQHPSWTCLPGCEQPSQSAGGYMDHCWLSGHRWVTGESIIKKLFQGSGLPTCSSRTPHVFQL